MEHSTAIRDGALVASLRGGENRLNRGSLDFLHRSLDEALKHELPWVLTGEGKYLSTGLDLDFLSRIAPEAASAFMTDLYDFLRRLLALPVAAAVAINGHAFGAAAILAVAADYRVMRADRGYFCFPEIDLGISMTPEFEAVLNTKLDRAALQEALITGKRYGGRDALRRGLVDAVADADGVVPAATAWAAALAGKSQVAMSGLKQNLHGSVIAMLPHGRPQGVPCGERPE